MKNLVLELKNKLQEKNKDLNILGSELMSLFNITEGDLYDEWVKIGYDVKLYDNVWIESPTKYAGKVKKEFFLDEEVYWYKKADDEMPVHEMSDFNVIFDDCEVFTGSVYRDGPFESYSATLIEMVDVLKEIIVDEPIKLSVVYLAECLLLLEVNKEKEVNVHFEISEFKDLSKEDKNLLLYQLIVLSYDKPLIDTLKLLKLC
ncbi:MAG: hypothetical protein IJX78_01785 [Bacilli bacterium]|nr:hypothetical protein [Bacilli bacterium]